MWAVNPGQQSGFHVGYQRSTGVTERLGRVIAEPAEDLGQLLVGCGAGPCGVVLHFGDCLSQAQSIQPIAFVRGDGYSSKCRCSRSAALDELS